MFAKWVFEKSNLASILTDGGGSQEWARYWIDIRSERLEPLSPSQLAVKMLSSPSQSSIGPVRFFNTGNHQPATLTPVEFQETNRQEASYPSPSPLLTSIPPTVKCNGGSNTDARPTSSPLLFLLFFVEAVGERVCPANIDPGPACPSVCPSVPSRSSFSKKPPLDLLIPIESF